MEQGVADVVQTDICFFNADVDEHNDAVAAPHRNDRSYRVLPANIRNPDLHDVGSTAAAMLTGDGVPSSTCGSARASCSFGTCTCRSSCSTGT